MNAKETELMEAIGMEPCPVLTRRPLTIAVQRYYYLPGLVVGMIAFGISYRHGALIALAAGAVAALALTVSLAAHEVGHLVFGRHVKGITPRLLLLRSTGGVSIVEGRYENAGGAALFAAGGPLATLAVIVIYLVAGLLLPAPFATSLLLPAVLNLALLGVNLLPVAPTDGYMLFRSALWASIGNRPEAERRAIRWSRRVVAYGVFVSLLLFSVQPEAGVIALILCGTFALQHHSATHKFVPTRRLR